MRTVPDYEKKESPASHHNQPSETQVIHNIDDFNGKAIFDYGQPSTIDNAVCFEPDGLNHIFNEEDIISQADCREIAQAIGLDVSADNRCAAVWRKGTNPTSVQLNEAYFYDHKTKECGNVIDLVAKVKFTGSHELSQDYLGNLLKCPPKVFNKPDYSPCFRINKLLDDGYTVSSCYDYTTSTGALVFQVVRLEHPNKPKQFVQRIPKRRIIAPDKNNPDDWIYSLKKLKEQMKLPLFNLPELVNQNEVLYVEGEKDVVTSQKYGFTATCNPRGAGNIKNVDLSTLKGKSVLIVPDNDLSGYEGARTIAMALDGIAKSVKIIQLPIAKEKADLTDYVNQLAQNGLDNIGITKKLQTDILDPENHLTISEVVDKIDSLGPSDGREVTSPINGQLGGRPNVPYHDLARTFAKQNAIDGIFMYRRYREQWYYYSDGVYRVISDSDLESKVMSFLQKQEAIDNRVKASVNCLKNVIANLAADSIGSVSSNKDLPCWLDGCDANGWLVMKNRLVNIENISRYLTGDHDIPIDNIVRPHTLELFSTYRLDYDLDLIAKYSQWLNFVQQVLPDPHDRQMLQMMFGLSLVPDTSYEVFFVLYGPAGTGKSVTLSVLEALVGSANICCVPSDQRQCPGHRANERAGP